jgi:hypothetical protein
MQPRFGIEVLNREAFRIFDLLFEHAVRLSICTEIQAPSFPSRHHTVGPPPVTTSVAPQVVPLP